MFDKEEIILVSPSTITDFEDKETAKAEEIRTISQHLPIGILTLAAVLYEKNIITKIVDLNRLYSEYLDSDSYNKADLNFSVFAASYLTQSKPKIVGLGTICNSYTLTILIASEIKKIDNNIIIVLGGPQSTFTDIQTINNFDCIDFIVRGEAEETFPKLLDAIFIDQGYENITGLTYRKGKKIFRNADASIINDLDKVPLPAFHLYPSLKNIPYVPLEIGRGCPFSCTFCSTKKFFSRKFRLKSPKIVVEQMKIIKERYGIYNFDLIHDMFTANSKKVVEFCQTIIESNERLFWSCSARTDCINEELISLMSKAGCKGIFFGIETGSASLQKSISKKLNLNDALKKIEISDRYGIKTAVSLITGFPDETKEDFNDTINFCAESLRFENTFPQLHLLAPLIGSTLYDQYKDKLIFDGIFSDMSHQGWTKNQREFSLIKNYPDIFGNFYSFPNPNLDKKIINECRSFILTVMSHFRLLLAVLGQLKGLLNLFYQWKEWLNVQKKDIIQKSENDQIPYYSRMDFKHDFLKFVNDHYAHEEESGLFISELIKYSEALLSNEELSENVEKKSDPPPPQNSAIQKNNNENTIKFISLNLNLHPIRAKRIYPIRLKFELAELIKYLREKKKFVTIPLTDKIVVIDLRNQEQTNVIQLSDLSAEILLLCDGEKSVGEIVKTFSAHRDSVDGVPADKACRFGLELLHQQKLIEIANEKKEEDRQILTNDSNDSNVPTLQ